MYKGFGLHGRNREGLCLAYFVSDPILGRLCSTVQEVSVLSSLLDSLSLVQINWSLQEEQIEKNMAFRILGLLFSGLCDLRSLSFIQFIYL